MSLIDNRQSWVDDIARLEEEITQIQLGEIPELDALETRVAQAESNIVLISSDLSSEVLARQAADAAIDLAVSDFADAVESLIAQEVLDRQSADVTINLTVDAVESALAQEVLDRQSSDNFLTSEISRVELEIQAVESSISQAVSSGSAALAQEIADRQAADAAIGLDIDAVEVALTQEVTDRQTADAAIGLEIDAVEVALSQEVLNRQAADSSIGLEIDAVESSIAQEIADRQLEDAQTLADAQGYADSLHASQGLEIDAVETALAQEVLNRQAADTAISAELVSSQLDQSRKLLTGEGIETLAPATANVETTDRHYFGAVAHPLNSGYVCYFTDASFVFVDARNPFAANIYTTLTFNTGGSNSPQCITAVGNYVFVAMANGRLYTIDWTDVNAPVIHGFVTIGTGQHFDIATDGENTLFLANTTNFRVYAVDITNRLAPVLINSVLLGASGNFGTGVAFNNGYLYVTNYANKLHTLQKNVGTGQWEQVAVLNTIIQPNRCRIVENSRGEKLLFAQRYNGVDAVFYSLSAPAAPVELKRLVTSSAMHIYAYPFSHDNIVHVGFEDGTVGGFSIIDISDPKFAGAFTPRNSDGSKKFSATRVIVKCSTKTPYFKDKTLLLVSGVRTGGTSTQKTTLPVELPVISFDSVELLARPTSSSVSGSIASEAAARIAADQALQLEIDAVEAALALETTNRQTADSGLQSQINTEKGRVDAILSASEADKDSFAEIVTLINSIDIENDSTFAGYVLANDARVQEIEDDLAQEILDRQSGDSSTLASANSYADGLNSAQALLISAEESARIAADSALELEISGEESARILADQALQLEIDNAESALAQEILDRQSGDQNLQDQIDDIDVFSSSVQDDLDDLEVLVAANTSDIDTLETSVASITTRVEALEAEKHYVAHTMSVAIASVTEQTYVDCAHIAVPASLSVHVDGMKAHIVRDFTVSEVAGKTRITWVNTFAIGGIEEVAIGEVAYISYNYEV